MEFKCTSEVLYLMGKGSEYSSSGNDFHYKLTVDHLLSDLNCVYHNIDYGMAIIDRVGLVLTPNYFEHLCKYLCRIFPQYSLY